MSEKNFNSNIKTAVKRINYCIRSKFNKIDKIIFSRNITFEIAVSSVIAMIVGIGVVIAGFVALFMYIHNKYPPAKAENEDDKKKGEQASKENQKSPEELEKESKESMFEKMIKNGLTPPPKKDSEENPEKMEKQSDNNPQQNAFQSLIQSFGKQQPNNEENKEDKTKNPIMPTINNNDTKAENEAKPQMNFPLFQNASHNTINTNEPTNNLDVINQTKEVKKQGSVSNL